MAGTRHQTGIALATLLGAFGGCTSDKDRLEQLPPELRQIEVSVRRNPIVRIPPSGSFAFHPRSRVQPPIDADDDAMLRTALQRELEGRGYQLALQDAEVLVGYHAVRTSGFNDASLNQKHELSPDWQPGDASPQGYGRGVILVDIIQARSRMALWRGSIQGLSAPGLPEATRHARVRQAIAMLMERFP